MLKYIFTIILASIFVGCNSTSKRSQKSEDELSICFTGDVLLDRGVRKQIDKHGVEYLFNGVKDIFESADATVINLECPVTNIHAPINKKFIFRADPEWLPSLKASGVTHAALANNHTIDQGRSGLTDTYNNLNIAGIIPVGYGTSIESASKPVFIAKNKIEVAIFNTTILPLENWVTLDDSPGICQANGEGIAQEIKELKKNKPECYVVVIIHWGTEYQQTPSISQRQAAYTLINSGTDVIIGHHPHIIQQRETYEGKPIFYSLGNFVFDQRKPMTDIGLIVKISFTDSTMNSYSTKVKIENCKPKPQI